MEGYRDFVYFGGGGGYELKNQILGYKIDAGNPVLTKAVYEQSTGDKVANYMTLPKDVSD